jgi:4'-phosphopantetheinyl transferase
MLVPPPGTVHVWWAERRAVHQRWHAMLDPGERQRSAAYLRAEDSDRFLLGAVMVRLILAHDLDCEPSDVRLDRRCRDCGRPHGKVRLATDRLGRGDPLEVSVSHSGRWVTVAATRAGAVGVDVERIDPRLDHLGIGRIALTESEQNHLSAVPTDARAAAFTRWWVRKEAVVKAVGDGLGAPLGAVELSPPDAPAALLSWGGRDDLPGQLQVLDLAARGDYQASLAILCAAPVQVVERDAVALLLSDV